MDDAAIIEKLESVVLNSCTLLRLNCYREIKGLDFIDPKQHLFCADEQRCKEVLNCFQILGYDGKDASPLKEFFKNKLDEQLGSCTECVVFYHRERQRWIDELHEVYEEEEVANFIGVINESDNRRIIRGLVSVNGMLKNLPIESRRIAAVKSVDVLAVFEALTSESFLTQDILVKDYFTEPFKLIQTHKPLLIKFYVPALTYFLFSDNGALVQWAMNNWTRPQGERKARPRNRIGDMTSQDFEFAIRRPLTRVMDRLNDYVSNNFNPDTGLKRLERFWSGVDLIVDRMDSNTITHGLRAMDVSVYRFLLDWLLLVDRDGLLSLLSATQGLLRKGPKDFWDALGPISSKFVIENIFSSPQYLPTLKSVQVVADNTDLSILLGWIEPFMASLQIAHKSEACQILVEHLMSNFQTSAYSNEVRAECYRIGLKVLATSLSECCESGFNFSGVGKVVASNIVGIAARHINDIVSPLDGQTINATGPTQIVSLCKEVLKLALRLECNSLYRERHEIHNSKKLEATFKASQLRIWPAISKIFETSKTELAPICLEALTHFVGLEPFESKIALERQKQRHEFNEVLGLAYGFVDKVLQTLAELPRSILGNGRQDPTVAVNLVKILFLSNENNHKNAINLAKYISGASFRGEAIGYLVEQSMDQVIQGLYWACIRIARAKAFFSTSRMLKIMKDALHMLCDDQNGILKSRTLSALSSQVLTQFWSTQWEVVRITYEATAGWAAHYKIGIMQDFCRDVMDYSGILFDQFASIESAIQSVPDVSRQNHTDGSESNTSLKISILEPPSLSLEAITGYLKLRDGYLLEKCVILIWTLLTELTRRNIALSSGASRFLQNLLRSRSGVRSNLNPQQKAEIRRLLEENLGYPLEESREHSEGRVDLEMEKSKQVPAKQAVLDVVSRSPNDKDDVKAEEKRKSIDTIRKLPSKIQQSTIPIALSKSIVRKPKTSAELQQAAFLKRREEAQQEKKRRDAEAAAKAKKRPIDTIAGLTAGEGSALGNLGNLSREHLKQASDIMVDSASDAESGEDQWTVDLFGGKPKKSAAVDAYNANKHAQAMRPQQPVKKIKQLRTKKDLRARVAPDLSPIHGTILSWDFFHDSDFPPGSNRSDYSLVTSTFVTAHEYRKTFEPLLLLEAWQSFRQAREDTNEKVFALKIVNRMNQDNLIVVSATLELTSPSDKTPFEGDILLLSKAETPSQAPEWPSCLARVFKINRRPQAVEITIRVARGNPLLSSLIPSATFNSEKVNSIIPLEREYGALLGLEYYDLCDEIIKAYPSPLMAYNDHVLSKVMTNHNLNKAQARAVKSSIDNDGFTLIQGPPGSGKTKTIVAIVGALLSDILAERSATPINVPTLIGGGAGHGRIVAKKLLVCAPSNAAVDELVMRFMHGVKTSAGVLQKPAIVRLGKSDNINAKVLEVTLDELVNQRMNLSVSAEDSKGQSETHKTMMEHKSTCDEVNAIFVMIEDLKKKSQSISADVSHKLEVLQRRKQQLGNRIDQLKDDGNTSARNAEITRNKLRQDIVDGAHILCATLSGSGHDLFRNLSLDFDTVIIDEAAQSIELSALIPLKYGCSKCIMVGDPKQLPPTVLSREASRFQYEQSLFVRIQANSPENVHLLDTQYRMHPEISVFPSRAFYDGKLLDGQDMAKLTAKPWHIDPLLGPYRFFDVQGMHQSGPIGHSLINRAEISIAIRLFKRLQACASGYNFSGKVGIITPYKSQLKELRNTFRNHFGEDITKRIDFNTTDAFQGRESEVIIFSCVRASGKGIGFLSDIRRMNVGITRAKSSLWVLGNSASLMQGEYWSQLLEDAKARKLFTANVEVAISQPIVRVKIDEKMTSRNNEATKVIDTYSEDIEMPDAPLQSPRLSLSHRNSTKVGSSRHNDDIANGHKKRPPSSPPETSQASRIIKKQRIEFRPSKIKTNVDKDSLQPKVSGNSALSPKRIVATSTAAPRAIIGEARSDAALDHPPARLPPRPSQHKKNAADIAFIKRKPPRPPR